MGPQTETCAETSSTQIDLPAPSDPGKSAQRHCVTAYALTLPTVEKAFDNGGDLQALSSFDTCKNVPLARWDMEQVDTRRFSPDA